MNVAEIAHRLSREFVVVCTTTGVCLSVDERAAATLGARVGEPLETCTDAGSRSKLAALLGRAQHGRVHNWELCMFSDQKPTTFSFEAEACEEGIVLVGTPVSRAQSEAISAYQSALGDLSDLHRETSRQKGELHRLNQELSDSIQGLTSLHSELDEKNDTLRRSADVKARLVANVSHEFRTPINSILGLSRLLLDRIDGELTEEQEVQVSFIRSNAETLRNLIDDVLDLSKIEAGKISLRPRTFHIREMFAGLRGTMRALPRAEAVELIISDPTDVPTMTSDDGKIAQILRNLVSNALKFTERGTVEVTAKAEPEGSISFAVTDTGIGVDPVHHETIFEDFGQIDSEAQRKVKGTGLGLSLSRRLASMLGGTLTVSSALGRGSTFTLTVPRVHVEVAQMQALVERSKVLDPRRAPVLVLEDDRQTMFLYEKYLTQAGFQVIPARTTDEARAALGRVRPAAIVLDVMLETESSWRFLRDVKENPETHDIPVMVVTVVDSSQRARALGADEFWLKPIDPERIRRKLTELAKRGPVSVLLVDDDETSRYLVRKLLEDTPYVLHEASSWKEAVQLASEKLPQVILLDFVLGDATAFDVIDDLKANPSTRGIPIIIQTAKTLDGVERERLARDATAILPKQSLSRELAIARIREALEKSRLGTGDAHVS
ncbi:MAG TPA: ATP-binding protein [Polyangiaceae bacterium]|nr:ATP-binding protein [Polyangiaceae bacterium]